MQSYDDETHITDDDEATVSKNAPVDCMYHVHFLSSADVKESDMAEIYSFEGFPGLYLIRNYFTKMQCNMLLWKTLSEYINPPSNSNLSQLDGSLTDKIWPSDNFKKFKWATIGHMYDWGSRSYKGYSEFPKLLVDVSQPLLSHFDTQYEPDAAIINCYTKGYFLRLHKDDAEETDDAVINISLGAPAIFAVGGKDQNTVPVSMLVDSGSVVLMARESRFCLHGIVKLLSYNKPGYKSNKNIKVANNSKCYGAPRMEKVVAQCPDTAFGDFNVERNSLDEMEVVTRDLRVSLSIRRAKKELHSPLSRG